MGGIVLYKPTFEEGDQESLSAGPLDPFGQLQLYCTFLRSVVDMTFQILAMGWFLVAQGGILYNRNFKDEENEV